MFLFFLSFMSVFFFLSFLSFFLLSLVVLYMWLWTGVFFHLEQEGEAGDLKYECTAAWSSVLKWTKNRWPEMGLHCHVRVCISFDKTFKDQSQMAVLFPMKNNHTHNNNKNIWNKNDCQHSRRRSKHTKGQTITLIIRTKHSANRLGNSLFQMITLKQQLSGEKWNVELGNLHIKLRKSKKHKLALKHLKCS